MQFWMKALANEKEKVEFDQGDFESLAHEGQYCNVVVNGAEQRITKMYEYGLARGKGWDIENGRSWVVESRMLEIVVEVEELVRHFEALYSYEPACKYLLGAKDRIMRARKGLEVNHGG